MSLLKLRFLPFHRHLSFPLPLLIQRLHLLDHLLPLFSINRYLPPSPTRTMLKLTLRASPDLVTSPIAAMSTTSLPDSPQQGPGFSPLSSPLVPIAAQSTNPKLAAAQAASADAKNIVRRKLTGYVGFANLPNQWHRKSVRKGFNFNVMVVGLFSLFFFGSLSEFLRYP